MKMSSQWHTHPSLSALLPYLVSSDNEALIEALNESLRVLTEQNIDSVRDLYERRRLKQLYLRETDPVAKEEKKRALDEFDKTLTGITADLVRIEDSDNIAIGYNGTLIDVTQPGFRALFGDIPLTPENFESIATKSFDLYDGVLRTLENAQYRYDPNIPREEQNNGKRWIPVQERIGGMLTYSGRREREMPWYNHNFPRVPYSFGWKKKDLQEAIAKSGLAVEREQPFMWRWKVPITTGIPLSALNIESVRSPGLEDELYLPGIFSKHAYMPRSYYENLYREIFGTMYRLSPKEICNPILDETGRVSFNPRRKRSIERFIKRNFNIDLPDHITEQELCSILEREMKLRQDPERRQVQLLAQQATELREPLLLQPGSRWVQPVTPVFVAQSRKKELEPQEWEEIRQACLNLETTPRGMLVFYAKQLDLPIVEGEDKESLCRKLTRTLDLLKGDR